MRLFHRPRLSGLVKSTGVLLLAGAIGGCEVNDFFNPGEPYIQPKGSKPLVLPVLDTVAPGYEEPSTAFAAATDVQPEDLVPDVTDYRIGKNDLLSISIFDLLGEGTGETVKTAKVSETGMVSLPLIPPVHVEGLTEQQAQDAIVKAYQDAKLIRNARVSVTVAQALARTFSIQGNVKLPGEYAIERPDFRMLDAMVVSQAPLNAIGADYAYVIRQVSKTPPNGGNNTGTPAQNPAAPTQPPSDLLAPPGTSGPQSSIPNPSHPLLMQNEPMPGGSQPPPGNNPVYPGSNTTGTGLPPGTPGTPVTPGAEEGGAGGNAIGGAPAGTSGAPAPIGTSGAPSNGTVGGEQGTGAAGGGAAETGAAGAVPVQPPLVGGPGEGGFQFNPNVTQSDIRIIKVPIDRLRQYGELKYNIVIRPHDMIIVPDPTEGVYYMGGHVLRAGVYSLSGIRVTLKDAWVSAGGADDFAIPGRSEVIRRIGPNKEVFVRVDLGKIWAGKQPDIFLKPDDLVEVGTDAIATFLAAARNSFRVTYGFGFLYDRNFYTGLNGF